MRIDEMVMVQHYIDNGYNYPLNKESREFNGLIYLVSDKTNITIDGKIHLNYADNIVFLPYKLKYHVELPYNYLSCFVINFIGEADCGYFAQDNCRDLLPLFEEAFRLWRRHREDEYYRLDCASLTYKIFADLLRRRDRSDVPYRKNKRLAPIIDKIHECYESPGFKTSELAPLIGLSERALRKCFTEVLGISPKRYLTELRIKRAKELLEGGFSVGEVSRLTGFHDTYHFSNSFKRNAIYRRANIA